MDETRPWEEYTQIAERTLNRCNMTDPEKQTIQYVAVMLWTESELADLEKQISNISSINPLHLWRLRRIENKYTEISTKVHQFQKTTSKPDSNLHELIGIDKDGIDNNAVSQIMTQLGWEFFPRHLNRFLNLYERAGRELSSKKQQLLTTCIILVSAITLVATLVLG